MYDVTTNAQINGVWRKAQGDLHDGISFKAAEYSKLGEIPDSPELDASLREMSAPVRLRNSGGIAAIPEGGRLARPMSANTVDAFYTLAHYNGRFTVSKLAQWISQGAPEALIKQQIVFQAQDKIDSLAEELADDFYGFSTGVKATNSGAQAAAGAHTLTLNNAYGLTSIPNTTARGRAFLARKFKVGEFVALFRGGVLVPNAIGQVTARSEANGTLAVTWAGNVTPADGDQVVKANAANATEAKHTSYNKTLPGLLEFLTSTVVHSISGATYEEWNPAVSDSAGGRYNRVKHMRLLDAIEDEGGGDSKGVVVLMSRGVYRDVVDQESAGVRYDSTVAAELDGNVKGRGREFVRTKRVPPSMVIGYDRAAVKKKEIKGQPDKPTWKDAKEMQDDSGHLFEIDYALTLRCMSRKKMGIYTGLAEQ